MEENNNKKTHSQAIKQSTEPDSVMTQTLELSDRNFMVNIVKDLVEKMDSTLAQVGNFSRDMKTEKKKSKLQMLEIIPEMKNSFDGLIKRLHIAEERINTFE